MKKLIVIFAIIAILAIALGAMGNAAGSGGQIVSTDTGTGTGGFSDGPAGTAPSDTSIPGEGTGTVKYTYNVDIYKYGTSTKLGSLTFDSAYDVATVRIAGNSLVFETQDKVQPIQFSNYKSIDTVTPSTILPGTSVVYITYTNKSETTHTHSYTSDDNATCTEAGTKSCTCGATVTKAALGHEAENIRLESCNDVAYCIRCGIPMKSGPCVDLDSDGYCDASPDGHKAWS